MKSSLLSAVWKEPFEKPSTHEDESVHSFISRRFNSDVADNITDPLCRGIFAGDSRLLSVRSCFPAIWKLEKEHGSILKGMLLNGLKSMVRNQVEEESELVKRSLKEKWSMWTLREGMQSLPKVWEQCLTQQGVETRLNCSVEEIIFSKNNGVSVSTSLGTIQADQIISSLPLFQLPHLLQSVPVGVSNLCNQIRYGTIGMVQLLYVNQVLKKEYNGFGFLVPSRIREDLLGITFDTNIFPSHATGGGTIITAMLGGEYLTNKFGSLEQVDQQFMIDVVKKSASDILGISESPCQVHVEMHKNCIPQYEVGHENLLEELARKLTDKYPITLVGAFSGGVGVNDVILNSKNQTLDFMKNAQLL